MNIGDLTATLGVDSSGLAEAERTFKHYENTANEAIASVNSNWGRSMNKQVGLIQDIENALVELKEKRAGAFKIEDIEKYNKKIQEAEHDLKEYEQAGVTAEKQTKSLSGEFVTLALKVVAVVATWKTFKAIMESTDVTASLFQSTIEGARSGLDYFMKSIATADFSNFVKGLRNAIRAGQDYSKEMSYIADINREYQIRELDLTKQIEELRQVMYKRDIEGGRSTLKEKIAAGEQILVLMKQRADLEIDIARKSYLTVAELAGKKNKLSEEELNYAIKNFKAVENIGTAYNKIRFMLDQYFEKQKTGYKGIEGDVNRQLVQYNKLSGFVELNTEGVKQLYQALRDLEDTNAPIERLKTIFGELTEEEIRSIQALGVAPAYAGKLIEAFGSVTEKERQAIFEGIIGIKQAENQFLMDSRYIYRMIENMRDTDVRSQKLSHKESLKQYTLYMYQIENVLRGMKGKNAWIVEIPKLKFPESKVPPIGITAEIKHIRMPEKITDFKKVFPTPELTMPKGDLRSWFMMTYVSPMEDMNRALADIAMRNAVFADSFDPVSAQMEVTSQQIRFLTDRLNSLWDSYEANPEVIDMTIEELKKLLKIQQDLQNEMATTIDWGRLLSNSFEGMANSISDALNGTENSLQAFGKFFADFIKGLIIKLIAATIAAAAFAIVMTIATGGANITKGAMKGLSSFGDFFKFGFGKMTGMQHGGVVPPGFPNDSYGPVMMTSGEEVLPAPITRKETEIVIEPSVIHLPGRGIYIEFKKYERELESIGT